MTACLPSTSAHDLTAAMSTMTNLGSPIDATSSTTSMTSTTRAERLQLQRVHQRLRPSVGACGGAAAGDEPARSDANVAPYNSAINAVGAGGKLSWR